ncbi:MAG: amidohydrolase family protein [Nitrososphaerales archaeon]
MTDSKKTTGQDSTRDRYRHIQGGLDLAVDQAETRRLHEMFIVDTDCHVFEPFSSFSNYLPSKWRKEYENVKIQSESEQYKEDYRIFTDNSTEDMDPVKLKLLKLFFDLTSFRLRTKEHELTTQFDFFQHGRVRRSEIPFDYLAGMKSEQIIDTFVNRMKDIGIKRSVIFPNTLLNIGNHPDHDFEVAVSNAFTDYMIDEFLDKYPELLSCVLVPANSPDRAADLIDRVGSEKGIIGIMITAHRPTLAGNESWIPIYEAARKKDLPVCFHASLSYIPPYDQLKDLLAFYSLAFPINLVLHLTSLVTSGVPERFPDLKFVFMEGGVTFIPWIMNRLDSMYMMMKSEAPVLKKLPSEYIKEFYYSSQPLERPQKQSDLKFAFDSFNADRQLMYASDYPHFDFDVPSVIYNLPFLSPESKKNILGENARRVFRLD